jgi:hypothetical protein
MDVDTQAWSGEGAFTARLIEVLSQAPEIAAIRVEDAPASQSGTGYVFLANEIYLRFATESVPVPVRRFGVFPGARMVERPRLTLAALESRLAGIEGIGPADYLDEGMIQYLRAERIVPPYQTRGYKLVEMVRIY